MTNVIFINFSYSIKNIHFSELFNIATLINAPQRFVVARCYSMYVFIFFLLRVYYLFVIRFSLIFLLYFYFVFHLFHNSLSVVLWHILNVISLFLIGCILTLVFSSSIDTRFWWRNFALFQKNCSFLVFMVFLLNVIVYLLQIVYTAFYNIA